MGFYDDALKELNRDSDGKCSNCRSWPVNRLIHVNEDGSPIIDWRGGQREPPKPAICPVCGRERISITVVEIEDWRGQRHVRPEA